MNEEKIRFRCREENCTRYAKFNGFCLWHVGPRGVPTEELFDRLHRDLFLERRLQQRLDIEQTVQVKKRRILKPCTIPGCTRIAQTRGVCRAHGGGTRCNVTGCEKSAQARGLCVSHGGGKHCKFEGCTKSAQHGGYCITHGGGRKCKYTGCEKFAQKGGMCNAHGGGSRCAVERCTKRPVKGKYCRGHQIVGEKSNT